MKYVIEIVQRKPGWTWVVYLAEGGLPPTRGEAESIRIAMLDLKEVVCALRRDHDQDRKPTQA